MGVLPFERHSGRRRRRAGRCQVALAVSLLPAPAACAVVVSCVRWSGADGGGCASVGDRCTHARLNAQILCSFGW